MAGKPRSLRLDHPHRLDVPILTVVSLVMLGVGVFVPALEFDNLFGGGAYSVLSGILGFVESGNLLLAALLFGFSVVFPAAKLVAILVLWFARVRIATKRELVSWLEVLGKWSLLDAFVITVILGTVQLGILSQAVARPGVYLYLGAILLSLVATGLLHPLVRSNEAEVESPRRAALWLTVPAAIIYGAGLSLPLLEVEKGWFWSNRFSLLEGIGELFGKRELGLATSLTLFVVVLPSVRFAGLIVFRVWNRADRRSLFWVRWLDRWSMVDVFVIALLVVFTKLGSIATPTALEGMWCLVAAAVLSSIDSFLLQRRARA